jgi:Protein of unknown function (DUF1490)
MTLDCLAPLSRYNLLKIGVEELMVNPLIVKAAQVVATGLVGATAYDGMKRAAQSGAIRGATVTAAAWGLQAVRAAETGAEKARLATADIVSEARARIGEEAPVPGTVRGDGHEH